MDSLTESDAKLEGLLRSTHFLSFILKGGQERFVDNQKQALQYLKPISPEVS